jgi:hypothetical protein
MLFVNNYCNYWAEYQFIITYPEYILGLNMIPLHKEMCIDQTKQLFSIFWQGKKTYISLIHRRMANLRDRFLNDTNYLS